MSAITERKLDPITFEVLRRAFEYAPERMSQVLQKASFSPIIYDMVDYSNAVFSPDVELIGQTAAKIRGFRPPEPYGGKGVRYRGERVREKAGKAGKGGKK